MIKKRTLSAKEAISAGADILVIGRPITKAKDPAKAAENLIQEIMWVKITLKYVE